ncbi:carboxylesterase family protein [Pseudoxanthomonas sp.]|uniref:carboxylesterase/lipase family protein n=1 Tax=Pseudoxanthomonas sp. TaxID=1871049 RepID=UPI002633F7BB|nr:carboxylesterase family protein [Pseudoxanthomonas sp.]WDS37765.1 MAG: carboxylesterase family protein [Pseudoxanthomonas sp.]
MTLSRIALPFLLLLASAGPIAQAATPTAITTIETGELRGSTAGGVTAFKGIPFAAPPIGELRWRAPQPAAKWSGVRDATRYAADCMQKPFPSDAAPLGTTPAEDCLYANVWKPTQASGKLPVMVWIYGGGFVNGGASPPTYAGAALAAQGIVVVSFNYRVGRFGTFAHPQLSAQDPDHGLLGNYGFMDQLAALQWVQRNIAAFGGDPSQVTIIGESAGGMSVHTLVTSPLARGLFQRAVVQSGGDAGASKGTLDSAEQVGVRFAQANGIAPDDPQALARLRALSAEQVTGDLNLSALFMPSSTPPIFSSPVTDGKLAIDPAAAYTAGAFSKVPMMIGATSDDIGGKDGFMVAGARKAASLVVGQGVPTWYYRFSYVAQPARTPQTQGAGHASEIPFFFDTVDAKYGKAATAQDRAVGRLASGYLVNFVKTGNPNGAGLPAWAPYSDRTHAMLDLTATGKAVPAPDPWAP